MAHAKKTIFIGSSLEAQTIARRIVDYLTIKTTDLLPVPWWEAFDLGHYTFEELNRQSKSVDAAIFLATKDDKVWYRHEKVDRPRDNIIFEYGLFANRLGLERTIAVVERGVNLPSDVRGVTYQPLNRRQVNSTAKKLAAHFTKEFDQDRSSGADSLMRVICHPQMASLQISRSPPSGWLMRAMYLGTEGARAWLKIANDEDYETAVERDRIHYAIYQLLNERSQAFRTYISLGPGDAKLDKGVVLTLLEKEPTAQCIPVDLSDGLLWAAIQSLSDSIRIPVGLLADFEENFKFVSQYVRQYAKGPYLYGLFGNTFGNLDKVEASFVQQLRAYLEDDDELMLDVSIVKEKEAPVGLVDTSGWSSGKKGFFAHGAALQLGISSVEAFNKFDDLISVNCTELDDPIAGTQLVTVSANRKAFARVRRYRLDRFENFFKTRGFRVRSQLIPSRGPFDIGVLALQKIHT